MATVKWKLAQSLSALTDRRAMQLLLGWVAFRWAGSRLGLASLSSLLERTPWAVPLLRNGIVSVTAAVAVAGRPGVLVVIAMRSFTMSVLGGAILFAAGYRFGPKLFGEGVLDRARRWLDRGGVVALAVGATGLFPSPSPCWRESAGCAPSASSSPTRRERSCASAGHLARRDRGGPVALAARPHRRRVTCDFGRLDPRCADVRGPRRPQKRPARSRAHRHVAAVTQWADAR